MATSLTFSKLDQIRYSAFSWRHSLRIPQKIALSLAMAGLTGLVAQIKFQLPWTPVPITGQTFAVLLSGVLLGAGWGGLSQLFYAALGFAGVGWFAGASGGKAVLTGATAGYIFGFILAALFLGYFADKYIRSRTFFNMFGLMLFANFVLIHVPGLIVLYNWLHVVKGASPSLITLLKFGTIPFIVGDVFKAAIAAVIVKTITPKRDYNGEADK